MTKSLLKIILIALLVLFCVGFIFSNSLKNMEQSRADSNVIVEIVEEFVSKIDPNNRLDLNYIVRKGAHLFEFGVLGILASLLYLQISKRVSLTPVYLFLFVGLIAFSDEFIQRFTGRGSRFSDVMIDLVGASIGICLILLLDLIIKKRRSEKNGSLASN